jgi:hypothetical protein
VKRALALVALVAACYGVATASARSAAATSSQSWAAGANQICRTYATRAKALGSPPANDLDGSARWLQSALPLIDAEIGTLARLPRPRVLAPRITQWIGVLRDSEHVTRQLIVTLKAHDVSTLATLGLRSVTLYKKSGQMARALGATACASATHI